MGKDIEEMERHPGFPVEIIMIAVSDFFSLADRDIHLTQLSTTSSI